MLGLALIRPPGHHVMPTRPMGFGLINTIAILARYIQNRHGLKRIFIFDFDVHHGNGTMEVFWEDADVLYGSTHQAGLWPNTGKVTNVGQGAGVGATINIPLPAGSGDAAACLVTLRPRLVFEEVTLRPRLVFEEVDPDATCNTNVATQWHGSCLKRWTLMPRAKHGDAAARLVFAEVVVPAAERFRPDMILVSAGYDAHALDPLASLSFGTRTYGFLASGLARLATRLCGGRLMLVLEGGYHQASLGESVVATVRGLMMPEGSEAEALEAAAEGMTAGAGGRTAAGSEERLEEGPRDGAGVDVGRVREDPEPMGKVRDVVAHVRRLHGL
ncbi:hypothetical protein FOA52_011507 [Chlamydomonas sp. UWO 241]|nr:hypothetical protein FOA52_011507 [Chlamydomonas sp. UWO 241]